jgi:hypothetical protein
MLVLAQVDQLGAGPGLGRAREVAPLRPLRLYETSEYDLTLHLGLQIHRSAGGDVHFLLLKACCQMFDGKKLEWAGDAGGCGCCTILFTGDCLSVLQLVKEGMDCPTQLVWKRVHAAR